MNFFETVIAASIGQILTLLLVQGFINSYWGRNIREEISRFFDRFSKHMKKLRK